MEIKEMLKKIDHTALKAYTTKKEIITLCEEALEYQTASVCIPASYVKLVKDNYGDRLTVCTVIGFPLGYSTRAVKVYETEDAIKNGADEIDMVINIGDVKNGDYDLVEEEIRQIKAVCKDKILKVIVETCYLTEEEKIKLCKAVTAAGADFIKTSTGFGTGGATLSDIDLFRANIGDEVKIKAAGGIRTKEDFVNFVERGCDRIGASATKEFLK